MPFVEYRDIENFPGHQIGTDGGVRHQITAHFWRHLSHVIKNTGYACVTLIAPDGSQFQRAVHILVLETFVGPRPAGQQACHNNGIRFDCRLENLRWDTRKANEADKALHGTRRLGERVHNHRLTADQVRWARQKVAEGVPFKHIGISLGVSGTLIRHIHIRKIWAWLD